MNARLHTAKPQKPITLPWAAVLRLLCVVLAALVVSYIGVSAVMADRLSLAERHPLVATPAQFGLAYESVSFSSAVDNVRLEGWYLDSPGSQVIIMLHGKGGNRSSGTAAMPIARALVQNGYDVLMFDMRGHGESAGNRFSLGEIEVRDLAGALGYLKSRGVNEVGTMGFSMGAVTELNAAPDHPEMRAIVADSPFANANDILDVQLPKESGLPGYFNPGMILAAKALYGMDFANNRPELQVARLGDRPLLLIHGTADDLIPVSHAYRLKNVSSNNPNLQLWVVPGAGHTTAFDQNPEEYLKRVVGFFNQHLK